MTDITKMICLGDSITWGYPYGPDHSWVALAARELPWPLINRGINGETAGDLLLRFQQDAAVQNPSHVVIMIGSNDASLNVSLQTYRQQVQKLAELSAASGIATILGMPVPSAERWLEYRLEKYRIWLRHYTVESGMMLLDFAPAMLTPEKNPDPACYSDGVHPSKTGYSKMAAVFTDFCRNL